MKTYKIQRFYRDADIETIATGLTEAQAQAHCKDPESSSTTATNRAAVLLTKKRGPWFDGYTEEVSMTQVAVTYTFVVDVDEPDPSSKSSNSDRWPVSFVDAVNEAVEEYVHGTENPFTDPTTMEVIK